MLESADTFLVQGQYGRGSPLNAYYRLRHNAIMAYGGYCCVCCGEQEPMFLTIDHVNNDGARHRREIGRNSTFQWLAKHGYPPGFQVLCLNCNHGRHRNGGTCPHQKRPAS